jgi:serine/threonine protein kinase
VAEALDYVHSQGLIHRDVKPANIMVSRDGQTVQVVDLGLAAEIQGSMNRVSKGARDIAGTAPYMAPEQLNGDPLDGKCDQYALPRNVVRGRRCFLAEKFGPIPQDDLDLSSDEFEKRLV